MPAQPDYAVALVSPDGEPDMTVAVVGDQVVDLSAGSPGDVLTLQPDGIVAPEPPALSLTDAEVTAFARTLLDDANAAAARGTLGLGSAATQAASAFDASGAAASAQAAAIAASQPLSAPAKGQPAAGMSNITAVRFLGLLNHAGPPVAADGTFAAGDDLLDVTGQEWLCVGGGSPGTWVACGSGKVLGSQPLAQDYAMASAGVAEDVATWATSFTYDGRPVRFVLTPTFTSQNTAAARAIQLFIYRSSDSAYQKLSSQRTTSATANAIDNQASIDSGPLTAWPSDGAAFQIGTTYGIKVRMQCVGAVAKIWGATFAAPQLYVVTT